MKIQINKVYNMDCIELMQEMKALQEYIKIQGFTKQSDKEIIISYNL